MSQEGKERPAIAGAAVDAESGTDGPGETDKAIYALKVMRNRGLISETEYRQRRAALEDQTTA